MKLPFQLFLLCLLALQACTSNVTEPHTFSNGEIEVPVREEIAALNAQLIEGVVQNNPAIVDAMISPKLREVLGGGLPSLILQAHEIISQPSVKILDEYHMNPGTPAMVSTLESDPSTANGYLFRFTPLNTQTYVSLLISDEETEKPLITAVYGKYASGWQLNILQFGLYMINEKTAVDWYQNAKENHAKGNLLDAALNLSLALQLTQPSAQNFAYQQSGEIREFYQEVTEQRKERFLFPMTVSAVVSEPQILEVNFMKTVEGIFPMIHYQSKIDLLDSAGLQTENQLLHQEIGTLFQGIDQNKEYLLYKIYNDLPTDGKGVATFVISKKLGEQASL